MWIEIPNRDETPTAEDVTPLAGVWIEILSGITRPNTGDVTPLAGVWIEIRKGVHLLVESWSLPLRECGLKYK